MKKVFCWGTFDILHKGHKEFFKDAKKQGDYLIIIVVPDKAVFENKRRTPINSQSKRENKLREINTIDEIITPKDIKETLNLLLKLKPDVFVFGYDQQTKMEKILKEYLAKHSIHPEYYVSKEFAGGIHSSSLKE